jgi:hypothetical protein
MPAAQQAQVEFDGGGSLYAIPIFHQQASAEFDASGAFFESEPGLLIPQLADAISYTAASAGAGPLFAFGLSRPSFLTLAQGVSTGELYNGCTVRYLAQDTLGSPTQREFGYGTFCSDGSGYVLRTQVLGGSAGPGVKVNFSVAPIVSLTVLAEDLQDSILLIATQNINLWISPGGSDIVGDGTIGRPYASILHAANVAAQFDYQHKYFPNIWVGNGTYFFTAPCSLPFLVNAGYGGSAAGFIKCDPNSNPNNIIFDGTTLPAINFLFGTQPGAQWQFDGSFTVNTPTAVFRPANTGLIVCTGPNINLNDTTASSNLLFASAQQWSNFQTANSGVTVTFLTPTIEGVLQAQVWSGVQTVGVTYVLQRNTTSSNGLLYITDYSACRMDSAVFTDPNGNVVGAGDPIIASSPSSGVFTRSNIKIDNIDVVPDGLGIGADCSINEIPALLGIIGTVTTGQFPSAAWAITKDFNFGGPGQFGQGINLYAVDFDGTVVGMPIGNSPINMQTNSYVLQLTDSYGFVVEMNSTSANTITIPTNDDVTFPVGALIRITQVGVGQTTFAPAVGVTMRSAGGANKIAQQWGGATLYQRNTDEWVLLGNITT